MNSIELQNLPGETQEYISVDSGEESYLKYFQKSCPAKDKIQLKIGSQVMLIKTINVSKGLVNGAKGIIINFAW